MNRSCPLFFTKLATKASLFFHIHFCSLRMSYCHASISMPVSINALRGALVICGAGFALTYLLFSEGILMQNIKKYIFKIFVVSLF